MSSSHMHTFPCFASAAQRCRSISSSPYLEREPLELLPDRGLSPEARSTCLFALQQPSIVAPDSVATRTAIGRKGVGLADISRSEDNMVPLALVPSVLPLRYRKGA